jgi:hypothetical protein
MDDNDRFTDINLMHVFFETLSETDDKSQHNIMEEIFNHFRDEGIFTQDEVYEAVSSFVMGDTPQDEILGKFGEVLMTDKVHLYKDDTGVHISYIPRTAEELEDLDSKGFQSPEDIMDFVIGNSSSLDLLDSFGDVIKETEGEISDEETLSIIEGLKRMHTKKNESKTAISDISHNIGINPVHIECLASLKGYDAQKLSEIAQKPHLVQEVVFYPMITDMPTFIHGLYNTVSKERQKEIIKQMIDGCVRCSAINESEGFECIEELLDMYNSTLEDYNPANCPTLNKVMMLFAADRVCLLVKIKFDEDDEPIFDVTIGDGDKYSVFCETLVGFDMREIGVCIKDILAHLVEDKLIDEEDSNQIFVHFTKLKIIDRECIDKFIALIRGGYFEIKGVTNDGELTLEIIWHDENLEIAKCFVNGYDGITDDQKYVYGLKALESIARTMDMPFEHIVAIYRFKGYTLSEIVEISKSSICTHYVSFLPYFTDFKKFLSGMSKSLERNTQVRVLIQIVKDLHNHGSFTDEDLELAIKEINEAAIASAEFMKHDHYMLARVIHKFVTGQATFCAQLQLSDCFIAGCKINITCVDAVEMFLSRLEKLPRSNQIDCIERIFNKMYSDGLISEAEKDEGIGTFTRKERLSGELTDKFSDLISKDYATLYDAEDGDGITLSFVNRWNKK